LIPPAGYYVFALLRSARCDRAKGAAVRGEQEPGVVVEDVDDPHPLAAGCHRTVSALSAFYSAIRGGKSHPTCR